MPHVPGPTHFPYTTLFRSHALEPHRHQESRPGRPPEPPLPRCEVELHRLKIGHQEIRGRHRLQCGQRLEMTVARSEEHTSELQSHHDLVCRLLLEKKKTIL